MYSNSNRIIEKEVMAYEIAPRNRSKGGGRPSLSSYFICNSHANKKGTVAYPPLNKRL